MIWMQQDTSAHANGASHASTTTRLIILDRRALIRECIASSLRMLTRKIEILRGASVAEDLRAYELADADVVMLSTSAAPAFSDALGYEIARLLSDRPDVPIVLIADSSDAKEAQHIISRWRLRGYLSTSSTLAAMEAALDVVLTGGTYLPPTRSGNSEDAIDATVTLTSARAAKLTAREQAVLLLLREGMPNKIIAHRLGISLSTVKAHVHSIMTKLHSRNRTEAAMLSSEPLITILPGGNESGTLPASIAPLPHEPNFGPRGVYNSPQA
jgi:DNA-binding NarL/FixJ family response regulator